MIDKSKMAHDCILALLKNTHANHGHLSLTEVENIVETAWVISDLHQAEADKRKVMGVPEAIQDSRKMTKGKD